VKYAGPVERLLKASSGETVWADGIREADCRILRDQFSRYAAIIRDPKSPAIALEVITNDPKAVPFFESLLRELKIPGEVVVRPFL
jgi:hypothetical protein